MRKILIGFVLLAVVLPAAGEEPVEEKSGNPYGLSDEQWEHVQENNEGRAAELVVGDVAPDFDLPSLDEKTRTKLSSFRGDRPVILFFGSYT